VLHELRITGLGVIDDLDLALHPGLNVLTGETGAGKTMVTVGLALALGGRGNATLVREGASAARIQARFDAPPDAGDWAEDGEVILARSVGADGKSSARAGGQLTTASALAELGQGLVEVHGQHHAQRLLASATQTAFLDRFCGDRHVVALTAYAESHAQWRAVVAQIGALAEAARDRERELDLLAYQVNEIRAVAPRAGESDGLAAEEGRLAHVERLLEAAADAEDALGGDGAAADAAARAASTLEAAATLDAGVADLATRGRGLAAELAELVHDVRAYRESLTADPARLQEIRERVATLKALQRKYGETDADVLAFLEDASQRLAGLAGADDRLAALGQREVQMHAVTTSLAAKVTGGRAKGAPRLAGAIAEELEALGMPGAGVEVALVALPDLGPGGAERVELRLSAGPTQPMRPIAKAASGGELSRAMLACRSVLADLDEVPTLVFDEVDAGIGGEAGLAVGRRLARLAQGRQVLVVTHLPQIACFADRHIRVRKDAGEATVEVLDDARRVQELSRMLAGLTGTESAASHAQDLLREAARTKQGARAAV
jgi:DNA repair protein RecN (Recombination protein N)